MTIFRPWRAIAAGVLLLGLSAVVALAAGPVETNIFAVQGVDVDVTSTDAAAAKNQALMDAQVKAFFTLVQRLSSPEVAESLASLKPDEIAPYLKSLSIEKETSAPGRYIGTFTVRFLPGKMQGLLGKYGVRVATDQAAPIIVVPVYRDSTGPKLWEDNPWRRAWLNLGAEQTRVPIIVPLGDLEDSAALTAQDVLESNTIKIEAARKRYGALSLLTAIAEPAENGKIHVKVSGHTGLGVINFEKDYESDEGIVEQSAEVAVRRIHAALIKTYDNRAEMVAQQSDADEAGPSRALAVSVSFNSPTEWNRIRSRVLSAPNVIGVDISTLAGDGAVIQLMFNGPVEDLQGNLQQFGLALSQIGQDWVIQVM